MYLYCDECQNRVNAQTFQRFLDIKKKIIKDEFYCPICLATIYIKESNLKEK